MYHKTKGIEVLNRPELCTINEWGGMGSNSYPRLRITNDWRQVLELLSDVDVDFNQITDSLARATSAGLKRASDDPVLKHTFWLLSQLPFAAQEKDFSKALRKLHIHASPDPSLHELVGAFASAINEFAGYHRIRSDIGETAQFAAIEALSRTVEDLATSLFPTSSQNVQSALRQLAKSKNFGHLGQEFFSRFTRRYINYHFERIIFDHTGPKGYFPDLSSQMEFSKAFDRHCYESAFVLRKFSGDWVLKNRYQKGSPSEDMNKFIPYAFKKLRSELKRRGAVNE